MKKETAYGSKVEEKGATVTHEVMAPVEEFEVMAPAGNFESLTAAIQGGADAIYFGIGNLNMRSHSANNFQPDDLHKIVSICKNNGVKTYLTLNIVLYNQDLNPMREALNIAKEAGVSAVIASDMAAILYAREIGMEVHISTQLNVSNFESLKFYARFADVVVLARELSLPQVKEIYQMVVSEGIKGPGGKLIRLEMFCHGALCMAVSGKCYLSLHSYNASANRGACYQLCRRSYIVTDAETGNQLEVDNKYIMSPKDLCTIEFIDKMVKSGVSVFKIEGRARSAEYVKTVTKAYKTAINAVRSGSYTPALAVTLKDKLSEVFNRGFWEGYYMGRKLGEWSPVHGSLATTKKIYVGIVANYFAKSGIAHIRMDSHEICNGDQIEIIGPTTGVYEAVVSGLVKNDQPCEIAVKGEDPTFPVSRTVRRRDKVYKIISSK